MTNPYDESFIYFFFFPSLGLDNIQYAEINLIHGKLPNKINFGKDLLHERLTTLYVN